jgi:hypothetical protein
MPECVHVGQEGWGAIRTAEIKFPPCEKRVGWGILLLLRSADVFVPLLKILFYLGHELVGDCSIDQAVVVA